MSFYPKQPCCVLTTHCKLSPIKVFCFYPLPSKAKSKRNFIKHTDVVAMESAISVAWSVIFLKYSNPECMVVSRWPQSIDYKFANYVFKWKVGKLLLIGKWCVCQNNSSPGVEDRDLLLSQTGHRKMCVENVLRMAEVVVGIWCMPSA